MKKLLVVTGGSKGIGRAVIRHFAAQDFDIITCARRKANLDILKEEMAVDFPKVNVTVIEADLSLEKEVKDFGNYILRQNRPVDALVNNTGVFFPGTIHEEDEGSLEVMMNTNLYSVYYLTRALISDMKERRSGHIFNMCSVASVTAYPNGGSYCISKFALFGLTKVLREEMKPHNVRVTAILPGATYTASWESSDLPPERFMKPEDVAEAVWSAYAMSANSVVEEITIRPQLGDI